MKLSENLLRRLKLFENYFKKEFEEGKQHKSTYDSMKEINTIFSKEEISENNLRKAIEIFNEMNLNQTENVRWLDLKLHLSSIIELANLDFEEDKNGKIIFR